MRNSVTGYPFTEFLRLNFQLRNGVLTDERSVLHFLRREKHGSQCDAGALDRNGLACL